MAEFTRLMVSAWIKKLGPSFRGALVPLGLSCIKVDEPLLRVAAEFWIPTRHVFQFNGVELCPTLNEFSAIMGEPDISTLILPTTDEDFSNMAQQLFGIPLAMA